MLTSCMCAQSRNFKKRSQNNFSPTLSQIYQISRISRSIRFLGATVNTNRWTQMIITGCCFICEFQFPNLAFFSSSSSHGCQSQGGIFGKNHSYLFWSVWNFIFKSNWRPYFQHIGVDCGSETRAGQIMVGDQPTNPGAPGTQSQVPPVNSALEKILNTFTRVAWQTFTTDKPRKESDG